MKSLDEDSLKGYCLNLEQVLKFGDLSDIDGLDLFSKLRVLREALHIKENKPIETLNYIKKLDSFQIYTLHIEYF